MDFADLGDENLQRAPPLGEIENSNKNSGQSFKPSDSARQRQEKGADEELKFNVTLGKEDEVIA